MPRYDLGDDEYYWFNIPFRGDGSSFVRGDNGAGISSDEARLNIAGASELEMGKMLCTLLIDVGCSVVVPSGTQVENVAQSKMWALHLGMLKCIMTFSDDKKSNIGSPAISPMAEGDAGAGGFCSGAAATPPIGRQDEVGFEETKVSPSHRNVRASTFRLRRTVSPTRDRRVATTAGSGPLRSDFSADETEVPRRHNRTSSAVSIAPPSSVGGGGGFFDEIPSLRSIRFWWCCGKANSVAT